ncbi:hypothetical protein GCM10011575_07070 [Microlunatus endophyticus]|uniref:HemN C-terminal domain-containing protein n=1 Tax=Microlunatus endophyticus TaxID=1716077 RepID=A0A917W1L7_9ACTN|nr:hypothetical protein [Microlunatus endophyticus]GGL51336.1 hypothetical protein GCM10011575_07070 [Microlunatus endophyticus]
MNDRQDNLGFHRDRHGRIRYGPWRGGPDPLAAPFDVRSAMDELGQDVLNSGNIGDALRDLLRRGADGRGGLDRLADRIRRMREQARRRGNLGGTLDQIRAALDQAMAAEKETLAGDDSTDARFAEMELDTVPDDVAGAVRALEPYNWKSPEARQTYESIKQMLRQQVLESQFQGLQQALSNPDPEAMQRVKDMMADLNQLLDAHARNEDTDQQFSDFMDKHGEFFPDDPQNVEELIDSLARQQAAAERMLNSLSREQRQQLSELINDALRDADLAAEMAQLQDNLRALRPGLDRRSPTGMPNEGEGEGLGYGDAVSAVADLADLEALEAQLGQRHPGATLDDVDIDALERHLGQQAARDFSQLRDLERELERQGYLRRDDDGLRLTPKAVRRLGETALRRVFAEMEAHGTGDHADRRTGSADEQTGLSRQWTFGDELPIDVPRTVGNALRRRASAGALRSGRLLEVDDFEVTETERRTTAAVALCVDLSFSMFADGRWGPMKQTALALSHLVETRFRQDALQIIGFNLLGRRMSAVELAESEPEWVQGTNLQHALMLASRHLRRYPDAEPVVMVVTDGEPTAHLTETGEPVFHWPTTPEAVRATVAQVDELARYGATLNTFMLGEDPGLARFVDAIARRCGGRVFTPDIGRLGEYVVADYLRTRNRGRR